MRNSHSLEYIICEASQPWTAYECPRRALSQAVKNTSIATINYFMARLTILCPSKEKKTLQIKWYYATAFRTQPSLKDVRDFF